MNDVNIYLGVVFGRTTMLSGSIIKGLVLGLGLSQQSSFSW